MSIPYTSYFSSLYGSNTHQNQFSVPPASAPAAYAEPCAYAEPSSYAVTTDEDDLSATQNEVLSRVIYLLDQWFPNYSLTLDSTAMPISSADSSSTAQSDVNDGVTPPSTVHSNCCSSTQAHWSHQCALMAVPKEEQRGHSSVSYMDPLQTDSLQTDSLRQDSLHEDSLHEDSLHEDSLHEDSLQGDTTVYDDLAYGIPISNCSTPVTSFQRVPTHLELIPKCYKADSSPTDFLRPELRYLLVQIFDDWGIDFNAQENEGIIECLKKLLMACGILSGTVSKKAAVFLMTSLYPSRRKLFPYSKGAFPASSWPRCVPYKDPSHLNRNERLALMIWAYGDMGHNIDTILKSHQMMKLKFGVALDNATSIALFAFRASLVSHGIKNQ